MSRIKFYPNAYFFILFLVDTEFAYHPIKDNIANQRITRAIAFIISTLGYPDTRCVIGIDSLQAIACHFFKQASLCPAVGIFPVTEQIAVGIIGISVGCTVIKDRFTQPVCQVIAVCTGFSGYLSVHKTGHPSQFVIDITPNGITCTVF